VSSNLQGIEVRPAVAEDLSEIVRLLAAQLAEHGVALGPDELTRAAGGLLHHPERGRFLVAVAEPGNVVGFAALSFLWTLEHGGRAAWLDELYVVPARRARGVGLALVRAAYQVAASAGAAALDLEVVEGHERVESLYRREGFRQLPRRRWARRLEK
jgi:GNAT superfamily N-acetyltransferase